MEPTETKQKLLDVAEQLFAEKGVRATSVRNIVSEAGVNLAAIHYHFGSKEALIRDVFARRIEPVNTERLRRLEEMIAAANNSPLALEKIIEAFVEPALRLSVEDKERHQCILKLMAKAHSESAEMREMVLGQFQDVMRRFVAALQIALPHLSTRQLIWRFVFMIGTMFITMTHKPEIEGMLDSKNGYPGIEEVLNNMIPFLAAGFRAPVMESASNGER